MVGGEAARDGAEGRLLEGKGVDIGRQETDGRRAPGGGELARGPQHGLGEVCCDHALGEPREGERRVAAARGDVEHARRCAPAASLDQPVEIRAPGVTRARDVRVGGSAEVGLDPARMGVGHFLEPDPRWARCRTRKSSSSGVRSKRRLASSTSVTRSASGRS